MKFKILFIYVLALFCVNTAVAREMIIAVSAHQSVDANKQQIRQVLQFLTSLETGSKAVIVDADNLTLLGTFTIPSKKAYGSVKARLTVNKAVVGQLMRFAERPVSLDEGKPVSRLPALLRYLAQNFPSELARDVVVLASPVVHDPAQAVFSMTGLRFPADGHLFADLGKTPYSANHAGLFKHFRVHIGYQGDVLSNEQYHYFVRRFWTLFVEKQGGQLVSFVGDLPTLFRRIKSNAAPVPHNETPEQSDKLEMIQLRPVEIEKSIYDRPVTTAPLSAQEVKRVEHMQIGVSWDCSGCDIDLYAQPHQGAQTLYYNNKSTDEGQFWKDYLQSPKPSKGRETISFTVPVDMEALRIVLNFYQGVAPDGVKGEIRLTVNNATYAQGFVVTAAEGNSGVDVKDVFRTEVSSPHTIVVDPLKLVAAR